MPKPNWGAGLGGAASGAATGYQAGGPYGAVAGGIIGGAAGLFGGGAGKKKKPKKLSTLDPQQKLLYDQYINSLSGKGQFADMYNFDAEGANNVFNQTIQRQSNRNFQENIIPRITGQFRDNNLQNSSYAGEALGRAGRDVQEGLDAQRASMQFQGQQGAQANKMNAIQNILGMSTFAYDQPAQDNSSTLDGILNQVGPAAGQWFNNYLNKGGSSGGFGGSAPASGSIGTGGSARSIPSAPVSGSIWG